MRRFYASPDRFQDDLVLLDSEETRHLARVLRLGVGAQVELCDGRGRDFEAVVVSLDSRGAMLQVVRERALRNESLLTLVLGIGLAKGDALDGVIRQAAEMGVKKIIPFVSARSEPITPDRMMRRQWRWQRLAQESIKSCRRSWLPQIESPQEFTTVLTGPEEARLLFWEEERGVGLQHCLRRPRPESVRVLIGPEGGFAPEEVTLARDAGFVVLSLGPRRLKVETAAVAALALIQYAWGDLA